MGRGGEERGGQKRGGRGDRRERKERDTSTASPIAPAPDATYSSLDSAHTDAAGMLPSKELQGEVFPLNLEGRQTAPHTSHLEAWVFKDEGSV